MIQHTRLEFRKVKGIVANSVVDSTAAENAVASSDGYGDNFDVTLHCSTNDLWFNPTTVATSANGFRLNEDQTVDLKVLSALSVIGQTSDAAYQVIVWE
jgi:hypothetical protein